MRAKTVSMLLLLAALTISVKAAGPLIISEFMSSNTKTLRDEDNSFQDWIEIFNTTGTNVNLAAYYLTDDETQPFKWQFPATNIAGNGFVLVFASSKDRRVPGAPLHANFAMGAGGEYLALVRNDGVVISQFPDNIQQYPDVPFGYLMTGVVTTNIANGANVRVLLPSSDIGTAWQGTNYDDSTWLPGVSGVGFDSGTNYNPWIGMNVGAAMSNVTGSAYLRLPFNVTELESLKTLALRMRYDDGFVAYLNGTEVVRRNAPVSPAWNSVATNANGGKTGGVLAENFEGATTQWTSSQLNAAPGPLVQNADGGSSGKFMRLLNDGVNDNINAITFRQTAPGLFTEITSEFDFRIADAQANPADGFCFLLIPTSTFGTNGVGITANAPFEEPNYANTFAVGFDVYPHGTQNDVSVHWNSSERINVTMPTSTIDLVANQFHRVKIQLKHVAGGARVTVTFTPNINGTPGAPYTPVSDLFIPDLNPYDCRVEFAGRTGGANMSVDLDNVNVQFGSAPGALTPEEFNISSALNLLMPGPNVLAIQGLNLTAADTNFLIAPELVSSAFQVGSSSNYIFPATPGSWNNVSAAGVLGKVTLAPPPGVFTNSVTVTLTSPSSSAQIRYTTDGTEPTASSPLYSTPLVFSGNVAVRARAMESGKVPGPMASANYILLDNSMTNFTSNLPLVFIDTLGAGVAPDVQTIGYAMFFDTNKTGARVSANQKLDHAGRVKVEIAGQSSVGFPKKSYNLELRSDVEDDDEKVELLGLPKGSDWRLYAPYTDKTLMNDYITYELHEAMGHYAVRRKYVEVFLRTSSGRLSYSDYQGVYVLLEKIRIGSDRVDIDEPQSGSPTDPITGGYIFKRDKGSPGDIEFKTIYQTATIAANGVAMQFHDPDGAKLTPVQRSWLTNHLINMEQVLYGSNWRHPTLGYRAWLDVDAFVDFHWIVEFPKNIDGVRLSNYFHKDRGGLIKEGPIWDWNLSWGNANYLEGGNTNGWYYPLMSASDDIWFSRLRLDPDFTQKITDRWGTLRTNIFAASNLIARIDAITNYLNEAKDRDHTRWPRLSAYVWPNPDGPNLTSADGITTTWHVNYAVPGTYQTLISEMKKWVNGRYAWIDSQFMQPPVLSLPPGFISSGVSVSIAGPAGTIYYTLDGTDPRGSNGVVTAAALIYSGPITLTNNAGIFARVRNGSNWSPPARGVYVVTTPSLRISEIMYHPVDPPLGSTNSEEDFEFVEIQNTGANSINLSGSEFKGGIQFTFGSNILAPGQFAVVVKNLAAFQSRYGTGIPVAGVYMGKLANSGDHLVFNGPVGEPIHDFNYGDNWYPITDGHGFSLVVRESNSALNLWGQKESWRAASQLGGSPGAADPLLAIAPVVVNEILANSVPPAVDWIELYNPLPTNVNVGGWFLTDDFGRPKKFRIVDGIEISANSYRVFSEADFNVDPLNNTNSFSLSSEGDEVFLFSADAAGNLTGYVDGFDFGPSDEGMTFGRYVASDNSIDYPTVISPSQNGVNAAPLVGPVVITEIMYRPPDLPPGIDNDVDEFIELQNMTALPAPLFSSALPTNTWHLRNAVDFDFPTGITLDPFEIVLLVNFSPTNAAALAAFQSKYNVSPSVRMFGPYSGKLDNSGERIELKRPGQLTTNGVPYIMVEKVTYSDDPPWNSAADGAGASLQRQTLSAYANDPGNWTAAFPTPGVAKPSGEAPAITQQPIGFSSLSGVNTNLSVSATGAALRYQWRFNGANVSGATNPVFELPNLTEVNAGVYQVGVFNDIGAVMSQSATVSVRTLPRFTANPNSQTNVVGSNTVFTAFAIGTGPIAYQWRKDGTNILNATNTTLAIPNAQLFADSAIYDVTATDEVGTVISQPAYLVIKVNPFLTNPGPGTTNFVLQGGTLYLNFSAGPVHRFLPLMFRYVPSPGTMGGTTNVAGTFYTNTFFILTNVTQSGRINYVVQNPVGTLNITTIAGGAPVVTIIPDGDRDGMADSWETNYGFSSTNSADALGDFDGDSMINRDEYVAGTNPTNALSVLKLVFTPTNSAVLQFQAESNISYTIQLRTNLNTAWQSWSNIHASNTVRAIQFSLPATNSEGYLRVITPRE